SNLSKRHSDRTLLEAHQLLKRNSKRRSTDCRWHHPLGGDKEVSLQIRPTLSFFPQSTKQNGFPCERADHLRKFGSTNLDLNQSSSQQLVGTPNLPKLSDYFQSKSHLGWGRVELRWGQSSLCCYHSIGMS